MELRSDHHGDVEELHLGRRQPIEPGAEQAADGVDPTIAAARLQGEQWVAAGCGVHLLCRPAAPCLGEEPGDVLLGERRQADHLDTGLTAELGEESGQHVVELGGRVSARDDDQHRRSTAQAGEVAQRVARRRCRPVHVLDDDEQRSLASGAIQIVAQRREDLGPLDRSVRRRTLAQRARAAPPGSAQSGEDRTAASDPFSERGVGHRGRVGVEDLGEGLVRDPEVLEARAEAHLAALGVHLQRQLGRDAALPHPGLAEDDGDEQLPLLGASPQLSKPASLL